MNIDLEVVILIACFRTDSWYLLLIDFIFMLCKGKCLLNMLCDALCFAVSTVIWLFGYLVTYYYYSIAEVVITRLLWLYLIAIIAQLYNDRTFE